MKYDLVSIEGIIACCSLSIIMFQLIVSLFVGIDSDVDIDGDGDVKFDLSGLITPKGILQFICGFAWYLTLIKPTRGGVWLWYDWVIGVAIGLVLMLLIALIYWVMSKLTYVPKFETGDDLLNRTGTITYVDSENPGVYGFMTIINATKKEIVVKSRSGNTALHAGDPEQIVYTEGENYFIN